ncbi:MAG TPA: nucleotidyl transferase, partial [Maribacter sp.]|nr:nucleotidyl transferase [Maribacter sp.]
SPRGTAGALKLINPLPDNPFLVTNGDVITDIQYSDILSFHLKNSAAATMAVRVHEIQHLYGVVKTDGIDIVEFEEKPVIRSNINAGVYVLDPIALNGLPDSKYCDMPVLFDRIRKNSNRTIVYPLHENWLDVGNPEDLNLANNQK